MPNQPSAPVADRFAVAEIGELPDAPSKLIGFADVNDLSIIDPVGFISPLRDCNSP